MTNTKNTRSYTSPAVTDLGTLSDVTLGSVTKTGATGDIIVINGQNIAVPGSSFQ